MQIQGLRVWVCWPQQRRGRPRRPTVRPHAGPGARRSPGAAAPQHPCEPGWQRRAAAAARFCLWLCLYRFGFLLTYLLPTVLAPQTDPCRGRGRQGPPCTLPAPSGVLPWLRHDLSSSRCTSTPAPRRTASHPALAWPRQERDQTSPTTLHRHLWSEEGKAELPLCAAP